jgi:hypothetical protein
MQKMNVAALTISSIISKLKIKPNKVTNMGVTVKKMVRILFFLKAFLKRFSSDATEWLHAGQAASLTSNSSPHLLHVWGMSTLILFL